MTSPSNTPLEDVKGLVMQIYSLYKKMDDQGLVGASSCVCQTGSSVPRALGAALKIRSAPCSCCPGYHRRHEHPGLAVSQCISLLSKVVLQASHHWSEGQPQPIQRSQWLKSSQTRIGTGQTWDTHCGWIPCKNTMFPRRLAGSSTGSASCKSLGHAWNRGNSRRWSLPHGIFVWCLSYIMRHHSKICGLQQCS